MRQLQLDFMVNSMSTRWIQILNNIEKEPNFTLVALSKRLSVSQRTLGKDINGIKEYFGEHIILCAKQTGYRFEEVNHDCYMDKKADLVKSEILFAVIGQIFRGELKPFQELALEYNYGESSFRRFLLRAEKPLKSYDLKLSLNPVTLVGDEENIRKFFMIFTTWGNTQRIRYSHPKLYTH
ncbi:helix-turn-helix domain-containing protein [Enterococcus mundtii]|nr:helix-turn-helix domain-containing protein [Enterococcus mundtii]